MNRLFIVLAIGCHRCIGGNCILGLYLYWLVIFKCSIYWLSLIGYLILFNGIGVMILFTIRFVRIMIIVMIMINYIFKIIVDTVNTIIIYYHIMISIYGIVAIIIVNHCILLYFIYYL
jgi:hypothetical protein